MPDGNYTESDQFRKTPSISVEQLAALSAAGLTTEQIIAAVSVLSADNPRTKIEARREKDRKRKALKRAAAKDQPRTNPQSSADKSSGGTIGGNLVLLSQEDSRKGKKEIQHARETRGKRPLPADFVPDHTVEAKARQLGMTKAEWKAAIEETADYWRGCGRMMTDWQAVFRNGIDRWARLNRRGSNGAVQRPTMRDEFAAAIGLIDEKYGTGEAGRGADILKLPGLG